MGLLLFLSSCSAMVSPWWKVEKNLSGGWSPSPPQGGNMSGTSLAGGPFPRKAWSRNKLVANYCGLQTLVFVLARCDLSRNSSMDWLSFVRSGCVWFRFLCGLIVLSPFLREVIRFLCGCRVLSPFLIRASVFCCFLCVVFVCGCGCSCDFMVPSAGETNPRSTHHFHCTLLTCVTGDDLLICWLSPIWYTYCLFFTCLFAAGMFICCEFASGIFICGRQNWTPW